MRAVAYIRVSTQEQVNGYSLYAQERMFLELCKNRGWEPVDVYREEGRSAHVESNSKRPAQKIDVEHVVRQRYSAASQAAQPSLCCPIDYEKKYLEVLPEELIERDYGCGDPSKYVNEGETVLDLGSGGGKTC